MKGKTVAFGMFEAITRFLPGARQSELSSGSVGMWEGMWRILSLDTGKGAADVVQDRARSILLQRELSLE